MNSITNVTLDLQAPNLAVIVAAKQNDTRSRQIAAQLRDGSAAFDATGLLCEIRYAKPDGTVGFYDTLEDNTTSAYTIDGNVVTFTLAEQMLTVAGAVYVDVNFYAATGEKLTAFAFVLQVEASVLNDGTVVSSDYYNVLTATLAQAAAIAANLPTPSDATPVADSASGSAGTGNGFARGNHSHPINVATSGTPANLGTASNGTAATYARSDHVHQMPNASDVGAVASTALFNLIYPVGSIYMSVNSTSPASLFGGTWERIQDAFLLAAGTTYAAGATGGEATHTLELNEIPSHAHAVAIRGFSQGTSNEALTNAAYNYAAGASVGYGYDVVQPSGSGQAHNNMPPYLAVYVWKRTA